MNSNVGAKKKQIDISVVVPTYNNAEMLSAALKCLICQETDEKFSYEIIVVINGPANNTLIAVREAAQSSQVPLTYVFEEMVGISNARNRGIKEARGRWIAWFDDDQWAKSDWLKSLYTFALQVDADCVAGTRLLDLPLEQSLLIGPVCREILGEDIHNKSPAICRGKVLPGFGYVLMARSIFDSVGLFDISMTGGGEDTDILLRTREAGFDIWVTPAAPVHHIILSHHMEKGYLSWVSLRCSCALAHIHCKYLGTGRTFLLSVARIGQGLLVNMPLLLLAYIKRDKAEILDRQLLLLRALGYIRKTLFFIAPQMFAQESFFARMEFRNKRTFAQR